MAQRRRFEANRRPRTPVVPTPPTPLPRSVPKQYGPPFVLMENEKKETFIYENGAWVQFAQTIAECRGNCQVKELSQKVNKMTRYEIRPEV